MKRIENVVLCKQEGYLIADSASVDNFMFNSEGFSKIILKMSGLIVLNKNVAIQLEEYFKKNNHCHLVLKIVNIKNIELQNCNRNNQYKTETTKYGIELVSIS